MSERLIYVGNGAFIPGVPARSLSAEEVERYGGADALLMSKLYEYENEVSADVAPTSTKRKPPARGKG